MSSVLTVADPKSTLAGSDGEFRPDKRKSGEAMESSPDFLNVPLERGGILEPEDRDGVSPERDEAIQKQSTSI